MAATSCYSTAPFFLPTRQESRYAVVTSYSAGQSQLSLRSGLSFWAERGFRARKPVIVSSLRDDSKKKYEIKAVPVVLLFKNGEKREAVMGTMPKDFYVAAIERVMTS